ncbi:MAG: SUMF1/EgtB/PvdO family nonheme iron enzyme [Saprospiraceae bacterium]|nr:SUMF1/EgtB/PvdO family nonheme iron enzyme [Saprospiraceae bacterium]
MKHILTFILIQIFLTTYGQLSIKEVDKSLAKINANLYASKYEVSNSQYLAFIHSLMEANLDEKLAIAQIDSSMWLDESGSNKPFVSYYHTHPAFKDYPVLNIRHDAAMLFCEWLTNEYNSNPKRKFRKVNFRLPTEKEWMIAARGGNNTAVYPWQRNGLKDKKGHYMCNFARSVDDLKEVSGLNSSSITSPVKSFLPNKYGMYNMSGNVAEMLNVSNIVKGGSWLDSPELTKIANKQSYDGSPKNSVGFRYFVEIIDK